MLTLIDTIIADHKLISFKTGDRFLWNPDRKTIYYVKGEIINENGLWSLLHELGHAKLNHQTYRDDLELLMMEVAAWAEAKKIAKKYRVSIEERHIERCVDSYRAWLHKRSKCIDCQTNSLQLNRTTYQCHNCGARWKVPESALCQVRKTRVQ